VSINEQDLKANEPTTFEDAEVEGHGFYRGGAPAEQPEVGAHGLNHGSPAEQPQVEAQAMKQSSPAEQDPKADKPTTDEGPEVEGQHMSWSDRSLKKNVKKI
jgi:hypothetical protein